MRTIRSPAMSRHVLRAVVMALAGACSLVLFTAPLPAAAEEPSTTYDKPGVQHNEHCVEGLGGATSVTGAAKAVVVRDVEGNPLQTLKGPLGLDPPDEQLACEAAKTNGLLIQGIEGFQSNGLTLYFAWTPSGAQYDGFVSRSELAAAPPVNKENAAGNGLPAPPAPGEPVYTVTPQDMWANGNPHELWYPGASVTKEMYDYAPYGRPAAGALYSLMSWSWIDVSGGGIGRAVVSAGTRFYPSDVQPIHSKTYNRAGTPNGGEVTVRYGFVQYGGGGAKLNGWMVSSHSFQGVCLNHVAYAGGGPALAGTLCASRAPAQRESLAFDPNAPIELISVP